MWYRDEGKVLRLQQQYFFVCATLQDILRRFKKQNVERSWSELPEKIVVQLNDTHPSLAILELMRILVDVENIKFNEAWSITKKVFCYTNHTVLPEACERWSQIIFERLLPRHLIILNDINFQFLVEVRSVLGDDTPCLSRMSIYEEGYPKIIRMCNLAVIGSRKVNGVAQLHTELLKKSLFKDFDDYYIKAGESNKFLNVTNGVTLRRWVHMCNPNLSSLITQSLKTDAWLLDGSLLIGLKEFINNETFMSQWKQAKLERKKALAALVKQECNIDVDPEIMLFDVHVKRIHEYKRQLLNIIYILHRYLTLKSLSPEERSERFVPRCCIFGGKAAPGYVTAKTIIKFIHSVADIINNDEDVSDFLKVTLSYLSVNTFTELS
jgi:glycogen phosphorylase